jgi:hypothetical protein
MPEMEALERANVGMDSQQDPVPTGKTYKGQFCERISNWRIYVTT